MWKLVFKPECYGKDGKVRVPEGKRVADVIEGFECPRCKAVVEVKAEPRRLWKIRL